MKEVVNNNRRVYELSLLNNRWNHSIGEVVTINYEGGISESNSYNEGDRVNILDLDIDEDGNYIYITNIEFGEETEIIYDKEIEKE